MAPRDDDFVTTISDDDAEIQYEDEDEPVPQVSLKRKRKEANAGKAKKQKKRKTEPEAESSADERDELHAEDDGAMDPDFEFDAGDFRSAVTEDFDGWGLGDVEPQKRGDKKGVDIDELVERRRAKKAATKNGGSKREPEEEQDSEEEVGMDLDLENDELLAPDAFGMGAEDEEEDEEDDDDAGDDSDSVASPVPHPDDDMPPSDDESPPTEDESDAEERAKAEAFFAPEPTKSKAATATSFQNMSLSRPILRGLAGLNFSAPTPIQAKTIPVALMGKDVVGGAVTGSGKTAAFMIPILERLLYRPKKIPTTRVVVLVPTRELAVQCTNVAQKLAAFTDIGFAQLVGGFSVRDQENVLRRRPDVVIATPGRFIDHMRNTAAFAVDGIEILVLDEADRMLEEGFADELNEILTTLPRSRQTMLFSATMTSKVDDLIRVGMQRPSRLLVDAQRQTVGTLVQEFVRLRPGREGMRLAYLLHLASDVYTARTIIFFRQKKEAHRVRVVFSLFGIRAAELHGSMTQEQRLASVEAFRAGTATHLLATDVASRGLDIRGVEAVLNYEAPQTHEIYLHRVGRTARMGKTGRACTLAAEPDRKVVKAAVKAGRAQGAKIVSRAIPADAADAWVAKLEGVEDDIREVLADEKEEKALAQADMQVRKGENMITHEAEIKSRPKRTWFSSEKDKKKAQEAARAALNGNISGSQRERRDQALIKGGKLSNKDRKRLDDRRERREGKLFKKGKGDADRAAGKGGKPAKGAKGGKGGKSDAAAAKSRETKRYGMKLKAGKKR